LPADGQNFHADLNNYIIVHVLERGNSTSGSPLYTDSVMVNYRGRLIPSATYTAGYLFDRSYSGAYNPQTMNPAKFAVSGLVDGFTTALLHMSVGDRWEVYIPYKLGYGTEKAPKSEIPGYSTLIFDIGLAGYYRPKAPTRAGVVSGSWIKK
jgi:FKBP-type peptidyl-prolyl cis-trans isomerase FklB